MHCRYCFRQHYPYAAAYDYSKELDLIRQDSSIKEIILSGGDPLSLSDHNLGKLISALESIPHLERLRFHSRFPIGIPERITPQLLQKFEGSRLKIWFVIHCNHHLELDEEVLQALSKITTLGIPVLNQGVLLKGVNDNSDTLIKLSETLINHGLIPYYLHQLDKVQGASHFEVSIEKGKSLIKEMRRQLPGFAVPRYVQDTNDRAHKTLIC